MYLPLKTIYRIDELKEETFDRNGEKVPCKYAVLTNRGGEVTIIWLTSVIEEELRDYEIPGKVKVYIQSLGLKKSKANKNYYDFQIVKH